MFPETFETDRLRFERFCAENIGVRELYDVTSRRSSTIETETEYLPWNPVENPNEAAEWIDSYEREWERGERAEWLLTPRDGERGAGELAGSAGLICEWEKDLAVPAIWLREPFWGRGYSGERAGALCELAFSHLDFGVVAIVLHRDNEKSYSAVEKYTERYGGRYEGLLRHHSGRYDEPADHHRFSISRAEYETATEEIGRPTLSVRDE